MLRDLAARVRRGASEAEPVAFVALLAALAVLLVVGSVRPDVLPYSTVVVPAFVGSQVLGPRRLLQLTGMALVVTLVLIAEEPPAGLQDALRVVVVASVLLLALQTARRRIRLGIPGSRGESMLVDLRDRILAQGRVAALPDGWSARSVLRSAGGTAFAGDFVLADVGGPPDRPRLRVALVDVSGKGVDAATRSLLLSGAMGGMLEALPAEDLLPGANRFLLRQDWDEGFATAVHLEVDLVSGDAVIRTAGHPPALLVDGGTPEGAGDGHRAWRPLTSTGPALGLLDTAGFTAARTRLGSGDALVLYTDGVVELPGRDLEEGVARLGARAVELAASGPLDEQRLLSGLGNVGDDRAVVVVQRLRPAG